jgi:predicted O-methyltransferase YrrM
MTSSRSWTPATLRETATAFQQSRVLLTAIELDAFSAIGAGSPTSTELAGRLGTHARATDRLLNALVAMGLLAKDADRFTNTEDGLRYLVSSSPEYVGSLGHSAGMWQSWHHLTSCVRDGRPAMRAPINDRGDAWLEPFIAAMHYRARQQADPVAALLPLAGVRRALDVGGGSGAFAMAIARRQPGLHAVVFDLPNVVPITQRYIAADGLADRVTTATGDYMTDVLPGGFDLVFLSAVVHSNPPKANAALIAKCAASLAPGGVVAVVDWVMSPDRVAPAVGALFALNMLVATDGGDCFTEAEIAGWLTAAGLTAIERRATPFGTDIMIGQRR